MPNWVAILLSGASLTFAVYQGIVNIRRNTKVDVQTEASALTTVIIKLEYISTGITEIKGEISNIKNEMRDTREKLIKVDDLAKSAHKRIDTCEKYCKRFLGGDKLDEE